jgi:hypothetical protein
MGCENGHPAMAVQLRRKPAVGGGDIFVRVCTVCWSRIGGSVPLKRVPDPRGVPLFDSRLAHRPQPTAKKRAYAERFKQADWKKLRARVLALVPDPFERPRHLRPSQPRAWIISDGNSAGRGPKSVTSTEAPSAGGRTGSTAPAARARSQTDSAAPMASRRRSAHAGSKRPSPPARSARRAVLASIARRFSSSSQRDGGSRSNAIGPAPT